MKLFTIAILILIAIAIYAQSTGGSMGPFDAIVSFFFHLAGG